ncbi:alpha-N-acetylgalactosaminidase-like [Glandiceps talaboti]
MRNTIFMFVVYLSVNNLTNVGCLDNGLVRTPPMGWNAWERFRCNTDCDNDPNNCISEKLFKDTIDHMVSDGFKDAGYEYVNMDDCWMSHVRDQSGSLYANTTRFPNGIKALVDYAHTKGIKFGIYEDYGVLTCGGYPGSLGHIETDAKTFAEWGVDYLKFDGCFSLPTMMDKGYPEMTAALNKTGRPIVYSCEWPWYQVLILKKPNYTAVAENCNLWRTFDDVQDSWDSIVSIINFFGNEQDTLIPVSGPGQWNDPDMLVIGNFGLSYDQSKAQMAMWSIFAAPLLMSTDLRSISDQHKEILLNKEVIAIDQDPLGKMGRRITQRDSIEVWTRPLANNSYASVLLSKRTDDVPFNFTTTLKEIGVRGHFQKYHLRDVFLHKDICSIGLDDPTHFIINSTGVVMVRITPLQSFKGDDGLHRP